MNWNRCTRRGLVQQQLDMLCLNKFAAVHKALVQAMEAPHIARMLACSG